MLGFLEGLRSLLRRPRVGAPMAVVPTTRVRLPDGRARRVGRFWLDLRPVTNAEWLAFCRATGTPTPPWMFKRGFEHPDQPVVGVSAVEARRYARWVGKRLPTEAEWLAAVGPGPYPWGEAPPAGRACFGRDPRETRPATRLPAAPDEVSAPPSPERAAGAGPHGHRDLVGLVWEHLDAGRVTVARGGFWGVADPRAELRIELAPDARSAGLGLRCAR